MKAYLTTFNSSVYWGYKLDSSNVIQFSKLKGRSERTHFRALLLVNNYADAYEDNHIRLKVLELSEEAYRILH